MKRSVARCCDRLFLASIKHFDKSLRIAEMKTVYCDIFDKNALFYLTLHFIYDIII